MSRSVWTIPLALHCWLHGFSSTFVWCKASHRPVKLYTSLPFSRMSCWLYSSFAGSHYTVHRVVLCTSLRRGGSCYWIRWFGWKPVHKFFSHLVWHSAVWLRSVHTIRPIIIAIAMLYSCRSQIVEHPCLLALSYFRWSDSKPHRLMKSVWLTGMRCCWQMSPPICPFVIFKKNWTM